MMGSPAPLTGTFRDTAPTHRTQVRGGREGVVLGTEDGVGIEKGGGGVVRICCEDQGGVGMQIGCEGLGVVSCEGAWYGLHDLFNFEFPLPPSLSIVYHPSSGISGKMTKPAAV